MSEEEAMGVIFHIPGYLRTFTGQQRRIDLDSVPGTVRGALEALWRIHPGVRDRVVDEQGEVRPHVNVFVGRDSIRFTGGLDTPLADGAEISIIPAVSGGSSFLFKTEPSSYSFADLERDATTVWDGVSNPVALKNLRSIEKGDTIVIYHTGDEKQAVGLATAASGPRPDPKNAKLVVLDLEAGKPLPRPVSLAQMRLDPVLRTLDIVRQPRLSVSALNAAQYRRLLELAGAPPR